jgi:peptidoglycan/LPS O-acetylase OafA/YrhL
VNTFHGWSNPGGWFALAVYVAFSFLAAVALYMAIERPFLRLREKISGRVTIPTEQLSAAG